VNACACVAQCNYLDEAIKKKLNWPTMANERVPEYVIDKKESSISDEAVGNDNTTNVKSTTRFPWTYAVNLSETVINIIDTPGLSASSECDTSAILKYLWGLDRLNAICVVVKSDSTSFNEALKRNLRDIFASLHSSASASIVFIITHSKMTHENCRSAPQRIHEYASELGVTDVTNIRNNVFSLDADFVKYLMQCSKNSARISKTQWRKLRNDWHQYAETVTSFVCRLRDMTPHSLRDTLSFNNVKRLVAELAEPLVYVLFAVNTHLSDVKRTKSELEKMIPRVRQLSLEKFVEQYRELRNMSAPRDLPLQVEKLDNFRTVCTSAKCIEIVNGTPLMTKFCCDPCGHSYVFLCDIVARPQGCKACGCPANTHVHKAYQLMPGPRYAVTPGPHYGAMQPALLRARLP